jgi:DNA (cytosine-5)-methyltransferase 1
LDLFCGAGGAAMGYHRAGFDVVGVDIEPQPHYPFEFHQGDALDALWRGVETDGFDAIHASPPCQGYSYSTPVENRGNHPDLVGRTRELLNETGLPWVMENVPGAPMRPDFILCGCMFGLPMLSRRRLFETSWEGFSLLPGCNHPTPVISVMRTGQPKHNRETWKRRMGRLATEQERRDAMGIDWMTSKELGNAIPPAYTEWIGAQLLRHLERVHG